MLGLRDSELQMLRPGVHCTRVFLQPLRCNDLRTPLLVPVVGIGGPGT